MAESRIVVVGGGFGGLFTALEIAGTGEVTLVSDEDHFLFTPMLYEYLSGEVEEWHIAPKFNELLDDNVRVVRDKVSGVDLASQTVSLTNNPNRIPYDVLVMSVGGITNYVGVPGAQEHSLPFRKIAHADHLRQV